MCRLGRVSCQNKFRLVGLIETKRISGNESIPTFLLRACFSQAFAIIWLTGLADSIECNECLRIASSSMVVIFVGAFSTIDNVYLYVGYPLAAVRQCVGNLG